MRGFKKGGKPKASTGGPVRGPGTGTSDEIKAKVPRGSYIMPADSTRQIAEPDQADTLDVNLSNGEFQIPPEQVHAIGAQVLDAVKDATHTPAARGFSPDGGAEKPELFFADGGLVGDEKARRRIYVDRAGRATGVQPSTSRALILSGQPDFYSAPNGTTYNRLPSQSRALVPAQGRGMAPSQTRSLVPVGDPAPRTSPGGALVRQPKRLEGPSQRGSGTSAKRRATRTTPSTDAGYQARARARADTAAFNAQRGAFGEPLSPAGQANAQNGGAASQRGRGLIGKARKTVGRVGPVGAALAAVPAIAAATDEDSTATYARRFGLDEPTGDGSAGDIARFAALRGLGFASDVGSAMTFGLADSLYRDKDGVDTDMLAASSGGAAGAVTGNRAGRALGGVADTVARVATRGRYRGDLGRRYGASLGTVGGGGAGALTGLALADDAPNSARPSGAVPAAAGGAMEVQAPAQGSGAAPATGGAPRNDVTRVGNRYSGGVIGRGFTVNGQRFEGTGIRDAEGEPARNPQNEAAVQALFAQTPEWGAAAGGGAGRGAPSGAAGFAPRGVVARDRGREERERRRLVRDASTPYEGAQNGQLTANQLRVRAGLLESDQRNETARDTNAATNAAGLARERIAEQGRNARFSASNAVERQRAAGDAAARGFEAQAAQRLERLYQEYEQATPEQRSAIAEQIRFLRGDRDASSNISNNFMKMKVPIFDEEGFPVGDQEQIVDLRTLTAGQQQGGVPQVGEVRGGYRFKGGDPANQNNWERI